jgi:hypothetical protein
LGDVLHKGFLEELVVPDVLAYGDAKLFDEC